MKAFIAAAYRCGECRWYMLPTGSFIEEPLTIECENLECKQRAVKYKLPQIELERA